jgi:hypothetical protein
MASITVRPVPTARARSPSLADSTTSPRLIVTSAGTITSALALTAVF